MAKVRAITVEAIARDCVMTAEEVRIALKMSPRQWARRRGRLPWSYAFGDRCPRITWGSVLDVINSRGMQIKRAS